MTLRRVNPRIARHTTAANTFVGAGSIDALAGLGALRTLVVCSRSVGALPDVEDRLKRSIGSVTLETLVLPSGEPALEAVTEMLATVLRYQPDWIVAIGGGSTIDTAKLLWLLYEVPESELGQYARPNSVPRLRDKARLVAVPTTVGSGSEVSSTTVFTSEAAERKQFIVSHELIPDVVVLDPAFLMGLPTRVLAQTAFDALSHAVEGYVSPLDNPLLDQLAEQSAGTILRLLPNFKSGDASEEDLVSLQVAAMLAGNVQNYKIPGIGHAFSHQFGNLGLGHGVGCAMMLPLSIEHNRKEERTRSRYRKLASRLGHRDDDALQQEIRDRLKDFGLPGSLSEAGSEIAGRVESRSRNVIEQLKEDVCFRLNPRALADDELELMLEEALG